MMREILLQHYKHYPKAMLQDFFKLLHQSEFGPSAPVTDRKKNFKRMMIEFEFLEEPMKEDVIEFLSPQLCRLHLQVLNQSSLSIRTFHRFFELSANELRGNVSRYYEKIEVFKQLCADGLLPFSEKAVNKVKAKIELAPREPFRHSETYLATYATTYRVVDKQFCDVLSLFARIDELMSQKKDVIIAIDGDCVAGKTTLASLIKRVYERSNIIHMDHFFLRPEQRTEARLAEPGGNIDRERFTEEVLDQLKLNQPFSYRPFNCTTGAFDEPISISPKKLTIVEGSYSQHPVLAEHYDLKVFLSIPEDVQLARILKRDGDVMYEKFKSTWIPMEKWYAAAFNIQKKSDLQFDYLDNL